MAVGVGSGVLSAAVKNGSSNHANGNGAAARTRWAIANIAAMSVAAGIATLFSHLQGQDLRTEAADERRRIATESKEARQVLEAHLRRELAAVVEDLRELRRSKAEKEDVVRLAAAIDRLERIVFRQGP